MVINYEGQRITPLDKTIIVSNSIISWNVVHTEAVRPCHPASPSGKNIKMILLHVNISFIKLVNKSITAHTFVCGRFAMNRLF